MCIVISVVVVVVSAFPIHLDVEFSPLLADLGFSDSFELVDVEVIFVIDLLASSHLYDWVCLIVGLCVGRLVDLGQRGACWSVLLL